MKKYGWMILYYLCLISFTVYMTLDTFVITKAWNTNASDVNSSMFSSENETELSSSDEEESDADNSSGESSQNSGDTTDSTDADSSGSTHHGPPGSGRGEPGGSTSSGSTDSGSSVSDSSSGTVTLTESDTEEKTYKDKHMKISLKEYRTDDTTVYVADVKVSSAKYLKAAFAKSTYGKNITETVSDMADDNSAVLAINGDNYGSQEKGYVIRNGIVYRDEAGSSDLLCIYSDGTMKIEDSSEESADKLVENGVWQAYSFGPGLIEDGEITVTKDQEVGKAMASNPRTAIGQIGKLHYLFVVSDGRTEESEGLSLHELADLMQQLGAETAYNLDGGGSSTMVFQGEVINQPTSSGQTIEQRKVNDIVYLG